MCWKPTLERPKRLMSAFENGRSLAQASRGPACQSRAWGRGAWRRPFPPRRCGRKPWCRRVAGSCRIRSPPAVRWGQTVDPSVLTVDTIGTGVDGRGGRELVEWPVRDRTGLEHDPGVVPGSGCGRCCRRVDGVVGGSSGAGACRSEGDHGHRNCSAAERGWQAPRSQVVFMIRP